MATELESSLNSFRGPLAGVFKACASVDPTNSEDSASVLTSASVLASASEAALVEGFLWVSDRVFSWSDESTAWPTGVREDGRWLYILNEESPLMDGRTSLHLLKVFSQIVD